MATRATSRPARWGLLIAVCATAVASLALALAAASGAAVRPQWTTNELDLSAICTTPTDVSGTRTLNLVTRTGHIQTPDGNSVFMWGFANQDPGPGGTGSGAFQIPGPVLCVNQGDKVTVKLTNSATLISDKVSIVFPGQSGVTATGGVAGLFTQEAPPGGGMVTYAFTASEPGTYVYESGTDPARQIEMGLYGALVVRPAMGADHAYNDPASKFDPAREYLLLTHDIDPDLHFAIERNLPFDPTKKHDRYWTINGRSFPDTITNHFAPWLPAQPYGAFLWMRADADPLVNPDKPALIRYANVGLRNHPFHPHGDHVRVIARDGRMLKGPVGEDYSMEAFTKTLGSGQTYDGLFKFDNLELWNSTSNPVPVQVPSLLNLVFKDGFTSYSGSPYLGETGDLPAAVTTWNRCGEFYFPAHSHALNEFQNFNEGFGGLATLLRIDPPAGCPAP